MRTPSTAEQALAIWSGTDFTVGRSATSTCVITHGAVSSEHLTIYSVLFDEISTPLVYCWDKSLNGTFHNGKIIGRDRRVLLCDGDRIDIRHACSFTFCQSYGKPSLAFLMDEKEKVCKNRFDILPRTIGHGSFGRVYLAWDKSRGRQVACKVIETGGAPRRIAKAKTEITILRKLCHPNVVTIHDAVPLITGGDLFSYLSDGTSLCAVSEAEALVITFQILKALEYLHANNVAHRDLKLDNVLRVSHDPGARVVLVDFGISKAIPPAKRMTTVVGTPEFSAPEVGFADTTAVRPGYDTKCDVWSLGVILHILLSGISPFYDTSESARQISLNARACVLKMSGPHWDGVSFSGRDLVRRMLCVEPENRYSVAECFGHAWIAGQREMLEGVYERRIVKDGCGL
ncbi:kinase-like domain-containing protein [Limtongia smithiae]|uniref:kinase-like domain-containing protein n=1 Tax=Limtongia smithiae TaxID=1125753 RepID=UPI0034CF0ADB